MLFTMSGVRVGLVRPSACVSGKVTKLQGVFIPDGDYKSTKKLTWLAKVMDLADVGRRIIGG